MVDLGEFLIRSQHKKCGHPLSKGCIFSHKHLPDTQKIPQVCLSSAENSGSQSVSLFKRSASLRAVAAADTKTLVSHLQNLGFKINEMKSCLVPTPEIIYLGLRLNSVLYQAFLSEERIRSIRGCLFPFSEREESPIQTMFTPAGTDGFNCLGYSCGTAANEGVSALGCGAALVSKTPPQPQSHGDITLCAHSPSLERSLVSRIRVHAGSSLSEKGGDDGCFPHRLGCSVQGQDSEGEMACLATESTHKLPGTVNCVSGIKTFCTVPKEPPRFISSDNKTAVAYINRHGGTRSPQIHNLARKLIVWGTKHFQSLRATHVPGIMNVGADLLSRGNPLNGEWTLHPQVVSRLWERFGRVAVDHFASHENTHCPLFFSLARDGAPMGVDALAHLWPNTLLFESDRTYTKRVRERGQGWSHRSCIISVSHNFLGQFGAISMTE